MKILKRPHQDKLLDYQKQEFNETVAVDLHQLEKNRWHLHMIDEFTRFSMGAIMTSKSHSGFLQKLITKWISNFTKNTNN